MVRRLRRANWRVGEPHALGPRSGIGAGVWPVTPLSYRPGTAPVTLRFPPGSGEVSAPGRGAQRPRAPRAIAHGHGRPRPEVRIPTTHLGLDKWGPGSCSVPTGSIETETLDEGGRPNEDPVEGDARDGSRGRRARRAPRRRV